jgi:hypothetical protein
LTGKRSFPVVAYAATEDEAKEVSEMRKRLIEWLKANMPVLRPANPE